MKLKVKLTGQDYTRRGEVVEVLVTNIQMADGTNWAICEGFEVELAEKTPEKPPGEIGQALSLLEAIGFRPRRILIEDSE